MRGMAAWQFPRLLTALHDGRWGEAREDRGKRGAATIGAFLPLSASPASGPFRLAGNRRLMLFILEEISCLLHAAEPASFPMPSPIGSRWPPRGGLGSRRRRTHSPACCGLYAAKATASEPTIHP